MSQTDFSQKLERKTASIMTTNQNTSNVQPYVPKEAQPFTSKIHVNFLAYFAPLHLLVVAIAPNRMQRIFMILAEQQ